jgi:hypothetical protein
MTVGSITRAFGIALCVAAANVGAQSDPTVAGQWTAHAPIPFSSTALHLLPTGTVMFYGLGSRGNDSRLWDPATATTLEMPQPGFNVFCSGHAFLADGRLLIVGGHIENSVGLPNSSTYDAVSNLWTAGPDMNAGRWYPTATTLGNGDVLVVSGDVDTVVGVNTLPQVLQSSSGTWRDLTTAQLQLWLYPMMHLAPNGKVFMSGPGRDTRYLDPSGTGAWTFVAQRVGSTRGYGSSVMYGDGKVLAMGGGDPPTNTAEMIDLNAPAPAWRTVGSMAFPRRQINATLLPDGKVLVSGGTRGAGFNNTDPALLAKAAEMWDPATEQWTTMASAQGERIYHSAALLLPDGRVLTTGGDNITLVETYSPPYLFAGARPTVTSAPGAVAYGESFLVTTPDAASIAKIHWIRLGSVTHAFDMNQRISASSFSQAPEGLNVVAPSNANLAPPGHYMLFLLNANGVPSVARIVRLDAGGNQAPVVNAGADQTITLPENANLAGTANDDGALTTTWSKLSGPGTVTFANANALSTTASFSASGIYTLRLTASDGVLSSADDVMVTVNAVPGEAGSGLTGQYYNDPGTGAHFVTLVLTRTDPTVNFNWGTGSPGPGVTAERFSVRWTGQVQAPVTGNYTFSTVSDDGVRLWVNGQLVIDNWTLHAPTTNNSAPIALTGGTKYAIRMEFFEQTSGAVARLLWSHPGQSQIAIPQVNLFPAAASPNQAPSVNAGADQTITLPASANLADSASDDGGAVTTTWSKVSGPGTVTFANAGALSTTASFSLSGTYVLRLTASDGALASTDDVIVTVNPSGPANQAPTVNAGADQTITMPTSANLIGTAIDDGLPNPPAALTTTWSKLSGPGTVTFATANALSTTASFSASGAYVLRLTASDGALASADDVSVTVNAAPGTTGSGLTGQYYNDPGTGAHFVTLVLTRTDPTVNFNWGTASPGPGVTAERFSVRWTGQVLAPVTGNYTFTTVSDDGVRLWVNGQLVINNWTNHAATTNNSAPIALTAGTKYAIRMEFYDQTSAAVARLLWAYPGQAQIVIPQSRLFP